MPNTSIQSQRPEYNDVPPPELLISYKQSNEAPAGWHAGRFTFPLLLMNVALWILDRRVHNPVR